MRPVRPVRPVRLTHWKRNKSFADVCHIKTQEFAVFCAGCIRYQAGDILLEGRYLHNHRTDFDFFGGWLLAMTQASQ